MMGEQTELALESGYRRDAYELFKKIDRKRQVEELGYDPDIQWKTQDNLIYWPKDMTDSHLQNTICMLKRKKYTNWPIYNELTKELECRDLKK